MSAADLPPVVARAADGRLPAWARITPERREHLARVAALMDVWADALALDARERRRWRAAGWLHDSLRDGPERELRDLLPDPLRALPAALLHGPAAAARLRADGVEDEQLLRAVAYHTLGHPDFDRLGKALYLADFLEPGRGFDPARRAALRARMPAALQDVLREVVALRLRYLLESRLALLPESVGLWNAIVEGR